MFNICMGVVVEKTGTQITVSLKLEGSLDSV